MERCLGHAVFRRMHNSDVEVWSYRGGNESVSRIIISSLECGRTGFLCYLDYKPMDATVQFSRCAFVLCEYLCMRKADFDDTYITA